MSKDQYLFEKACFRVIHIMKTCRDMKPSNILYDRGRVKLIDFGLARYDTNFLANINKEPYDMKNQARTSSSCDSSSSKLDPIIDFYLKKTPNLVTLWYRPLELLLGSRDYDRSIDMWSVGCIFAELLLMRPLFNADNEIQAIEMILKLLGVSSEDKEMLSHLPYYKQYFASGSLLKKYEKANAHDNFMNLFEYAGVDEAAIDLIEGLLKLNPRKRLTVKQALNHRYFKIHPPAASLDQMPSFLFSHRSPQHHKRHHHYHRRYNRYAEEDHHRGHDSHDSYREDRYRSHYHTENVFDGGNGSSRYHGSNMDHQHHKRSYQPTDRSYDRDNPHHLPSNTDRTNHKRYKHFE